MLLRDRARSDGGFTLVELMVVVAIMGILVAIASASYFVTIERSRKIACVHNQRLIDSALMQYQTVHNGAYPPDLASTETYVKWSGPGYATCASDHTVAFTYDPVTGIVACPNHPR